MAQKITVEEWRAEAVRRFGPKALAWAFECPICKHVQTGSDFIKLGADPHSAYQECIGRKMDGRASRLGSKPGKNGELSPCDYAAFGLFRAMGEGAYLVIPEDESESSHEGVPVFPFAQIAHAVNPQAAEGSEESAKERCAHEHLNEDGMCRRCGLDCRGIHN